jgi:hypothetical protein
MKQLLFICCLLTACLSQAQNVTLTLSKKFALRDPGMTDKDGSTFKLGEAYYSMEVDFKNMQLAYTAKLDKIKYGINLYKYDQDMKEVKKVVFLNKERELGPFEPKIVVFRQQLLLFYYKVAEDNSIRLLYAVIDPETLEAKDSKELYSISQKNVGLFKISGILEHNTLQFARNPDNTKLLVSQSGNINELFSCVIDGDLQPGKKITSRPKGDMDNLSIRDCAWDNNENRYFAYNYTLDKKGKQGILVLDNKDKETYLPFTVSRDSEFDADPLSFKLSKDKARLYVFTTYGAGNNMAEGLLLTTVTDEGSKPSIAKPLLFPYSPELREKLRKRDFADKSHGNIGVKDISYRCTELEDGALALTGYPLNIDQSDILGANAIPKGTITRIYAGPVINVLVKGGKANFGVLYRNQQYSKTGGFITHAYGDQLVIIYNDDKKNLESKDPSELERTADLSDLVLAEAVIGSDGNVISRKAIGDRVSNLNYLTGDFQRLPEQQYLFPLGRTRVNMVRYYNEIEQWVTLHIE